MLGCILLGAGLGHAQPATQVEQSLVQSIEVGNKHCPVTGREIGQMGPAFKYEYKGKIYNLCCGGCPRTFNTEPEKYSKIAEDEVKN